MNQANSVLSKDEVLKVLTNHLKEESNTSTEKMRTKIHEVLRERKVIGEVTQSMYGGTTTYNRRISNEDEMLISECIYDLLYQRVITPGVNSSNLDLPFVHVSDREKLNNY